MRLCSQNLKIGIFGYEPFVKREKHGLSGPFGELYNQLVFSKAPTPNCSVQVIPQLSGDSNERNATWIYLFQNTSVDLILSREKLGSNNGVIEETDVVGITT